MTKEGKRGLGGRPRTHILLPGTSESLFCGVHMDLAAHTF
jgi:hypothetical protein